jgi:cell division initiation protein
MNISPLFIKRQEFTRVMRGFDADEVKDFLEKIAKQIETLMEENESLNQEIRALNEKVVEYQKIEKNLQDTLLKAQESSTRTMESTKKQTNLMVKEAEIKAAQIIEKAKENANEIRNAVISLREERNLIASKLKAIISSQTTLLEGKVKEAGDETAKPKKQEKAENIDIDVDDIVNKIL